MTDNKWLVTVSVGFGAIMATIDSSIVNVAMPYIRGTVGASIEEITWVSTAYMIAMVLVMPLVGFLGTLFGQKRVYLAGLVVFIAGSALCGFARSLESLIAFRALQGLGGGTLQPTQQAILRQTFPAREQGMAMAMFGMVVMVGPAVGPTLGGWITDHYNWPWIFYINLPIGAIGTLLTWRFVHEPEDVRRENQALARVQKRSLDWAGIALMAVGVAALQYTLEEGHRDDWFESSTIVATSILASVALAAFTVRELTTSVPAVDLRLFRDSSFLAGTLVGGVQFSVLMAGMFLLPVFVQEMLGFDATDAGILLAPRSLVMMAVTPVIGWLYNRVPPGLTVGIGIALFAVSSWQLSHVTLASTAWDMLPAMIVSGVAFACLFVPLTTAALGGIPRAKLAYATGLNSFVRQIGGSVGLAVFATLLDRFAIQAKAGLAAGVTAANPAVVSEFRRAAAGLAAHGFDAGTAHALAGDLLVKRVAAQGMVLSFEKTFLLQGLMFLAVLPLVLFLRRSRETGPVEVPAD